MAETVSSNRPIVDREKTAPFLIRTFLKIGAFHRLAQFEEGPLPIADEQQIFTWKDATLREVLTTLRTTAPNTPEYRHPLARYTFRAIYADATNRGRIAQKDLGTVYSRDILGEPGTLDTPAARLLQDEDPSGDEVKEGLASDKDREEKSLDELRFMPGDYLCVMVVLPKNVAVPTGPGGELSIKGSGLPSPANGWKTGGAGRGGDGGWGGSLGSSGPGLGRGSGGHWRGGSDPNPSGPRGGGRGGPGGGRGDFGGRERRIPPPRRVRPPHPG
ncbi:hypothetical protein NLI96_g8970 [Meripilus lineatus]|uniref:Histone deacetylase complex subunit SAP18 n=1 Tax=Meripilus lineatus TaxID=2056292 RepID=A0AAD5V119_9APHY|nr:hypothetical protein NLI96_g8970 [Physisporinus lineatus]